MRSRGLVTTPSHEHGPDLTNEEIGALTRLLREKIDNDRYPLSPRIQLLIMLSAHACKRNADQLPFLHYTAAALPRSVSAIGEMGLFMRARRLRAEARTPWWEPSPLSKLRHPRGEVLPGNAGGQR
jgi:hypothetical protein